MLKFGINYLRHVQCEEGRIVRANKLARFLTRRLNSKLGPKTLSPAKIKQNAYTISKEGTKEGTHLKREE